MNDFPVNDDDNIYVETKIEFGSDKNNNTEKPHNGKPITIIEVSPKGKYLVTYSEEDESIVGWNVNDVDEGQLKSDYCNTIKLKNVHKMCVSDDKIFACIYDDHYKLSKLYLFNIYLIINNSNLFSLFFYILLEIIDMKNDKEIESNLCVYSDTYYDCIFNLESEFIFYNEIINRHDIYQKIIWIYSTQTGNNKWTCKGIYKIPDDFELISISKYDSKVYLLSNNNIYEWNILTGKGIKIFGNEKKEYEVINNLNYLSECSNIIITHYLFF